MLLLFYPEPDLIRLLLITGPCGITFEPGSALNVKTVCLGGALKDISEGGGTIFGAGILIWCCDIFWDGKVEFLPNEAYIGGLTPRKVGGGALFF